MSKIYTITEVVHTIVRHCSGLFSFVWVEGEVSNCSYSSSGTLYFSLKEGNLLLDCVWFESKQKNEIYFDVLTGEVKEQPTLCVSKTIKNGDYLYVAGSLVIYKERSKYQLCVELAEYIRQGKYENALQEKKNKLEAEGLFNPYYKKKIPKNPQRVALITSKEGAALQDFLHVTMSRGIGGTLLLYNTLMQGNHAVTEICNALYVANQSNADIIVLIRGGGAKEEIDIFNDERIVRAIFSSRLPVITGIGHEIDETLSDCVADATGITPTFVANMLFEQRSTIKERIQGIFTLLYQAVYHMLYLCERRLTAESMELSIAMLEKYKDKEERIAIINKKYSECMNAQLLFREQRVCAIIRRYESLSNYFCKDRNERCIYFVHYLYKNMYISYRDNYLLYSTVKKRLESYSFFAILTNMVEKLERLLQRMHKAIEHYYMFVTHRMRSCMTILRLVSPERIIAQGYVCVEDASKRRITQIASLEASLLRLHFRDGIIDVRVISKEE